VLAHVGPHRVAGIALPPVDANSLRRRSFIVALAVCERMRKAVLLGAVAGMVSVVRTLHRRLHRPSAVGDPHARRN